MLAFFDRPIAGCEQTGFQVNLNPFAAYDAWLAQASGYHRRVAGYPAAAGYDTHGCRDSVDIVWLGLRPDQDHRHSGGC